MICVFIFFIHLVMFAITGTGFLKNEEALLLAILAEIPLDLSLGLIGGNIICYFIYRRNND